MLVGSTNIGAETAKVYVEVVVTRVFVIQEGNRAGVIV